MTTVDELQSQLQLLQEDRKRDYESFAEQKLKFVKTIQSLQGNFSEAKEQFETTIQKLRGDIKCQSSLEERLKRLEVLVSAAPETPRHAGDDDQPRSTGKRPRRTPPLTSYEHDGLPDCADVNRHSSNELGELAISLSFGDDPTPASLERFLDHYCLIQEINGERGIRTWDKPSYRALMLRMALRRTAADYINQNARGLSPWVRDDTEIIKRLRSRYMKMQIFFKGPSAKLTALYVEQLDLIEDVKVKIQQKEGIPAEQQRIVLRGKQLLDGQTLSDYNVTKADLLYVHRRISKKRKAGGAHVQIIADNRSKIQRTAAGRR